jgi:hypothetical protein
MQRPSLQAGDVTGRSGHGECVDMRCDRRSVAAMLNRRDDGRGQLFERFAERMASYAPHLDMFSVATKYGEFEMAVYISTRHLPARWRPFATLVLMRMHLPFI